MRFPRSAQCLGLLLAIVLSGCDSMSPSSPEKTIARAEQKAASGDYPGAIALYEKALDGTRQTAEVHFRLGLIYDDKLNDKVGAIYNFRRYLEFEPTGKRADEIKTFVAKAELGLMTSLSHGVVLSEPEARQLRKDNFALSKENTTLKEQLAEARKGMKTGVLAPGTKPKPVPPSARTYIVQNGDTLAAISRKFYNTSEKWKDILDANAGTLQDAAKLKVGMRLVIP